MICPKIKITSSSINIPEANKLREIAHLCAQSGHPALEIGSYIGTSTIFIADRYKAFGNVVFAVDHHRGSQEHQQGENNHDTEYFDDAVGKYDTFSTFRQQIENHGQEEAVIPIVADANILARYWTIPLSMIFIDGEHDLISPTRDYTNWVKHLIPGGYMIFHDVWMDKAERSINGRRDGPYLAMRTAMDSGLFDKHGTYNTLGILRRKSDLDKAKD